MRSGANTARAARPACAAEAETVPLCFCALTWHDLYLFQVGLKAQSRRAIAAANRPAPRPPIGIIGGGEAVVGRSRVGSALASA